MTTPARRRDVVRLMLAGWALVGQVPTFLAAQPPAVVDPRATDGDDRGQPRWDERLTLTVGMTGCDLNGSTDRVVQAAVDSVARKGGGTVRLLPGTWMLRNSVSLPSRVRLVGSGSDTILTRPASVSSPLAADSDWYDQEITVADGRGFEVGDGVVLRAVDPHHGGATVVKRTLTGRSGNRFLLDDGLRKDLWMSGKPTCESLFPLLTAERATDVQIENLVLDGNRDQTGHLDGNFGGCIFLQDCNRITMRRIEARNNNGDGISFQICHDVLLEDCHSHGHADLGVHAGSGSQRPVMRNNRLERNSQGLYWCWGVKFGLAEHNVIEGNRLYGISIGHNDTDNLLRKNTIRGSGQCGVLFRHDDRGLDFWPSRNVLQDNLIENSGGDEGAAIEVLGKPRDLEFIGNRLVETRGAARRIGIRISAEAGSVRMSDNTITGMHTAVLDQRPTEERR